MNPKVIPVTFRDEIQFLNRMLDRGDVCHTVDEFDRKVVRSIMKKVRLIKKEFYPMNK